MQKPWPKPAGGVGRQQVRLQGWIRTRRDSKGGFSFLELNDGSSIGNIQIIADAALANYESEIKHLSAGCSVTVEGEVKASPAKGQATEVAGQRVIVVHGWADPETYPLQKKRHSFEFLRTIAHLRPRTNTFGAIARVRNCVCRSIHEFFQEEGFLYLHTPIITASDCEGAGEMFKVTTLDLAKVPKTRPRRSITRRIFSSGRRFSPSAASWTARSSPVRWARSTPSARRFAPKTRTPRGTWPSSGWSSRKWRSSSWPTTCTWPSGS